MTLSTVAHDTFVIERTYDVPVAQVFRAWADPKLKARWFAGSAEALGAGYELDFRVGGREVNRGGPPGGPVYHLRLAVPRHRSRTADRLHLRDVRRREPDLRCRSPRSSSTTMRQRPNWSSPSRGCSSTAMTPRPRREEGTRVPPGLAGRLLARRCIVRKACSASRHRGVGDVRRVHHQEATSMRTLASFILISLDGFYEGPNGEFDWPVVDEEFGDFAIRQLDAGGRPWGSVGPPTNTWPPTGRPNRPKPTTLPSPPG